MPPRAMPETASSKAGITWTFEKKQAYTKFYVFWKRPLQKQLKHKNEERRRKLYIWVVKLF